MSSSSKCGFCGFHPKWLQNWATSRSFIAVYGLLGTVQSMAFIYIVVSLTTLEKRFKIPSRTTGLILSGNEISQILSVLLIYYGGSGHRPRWIAIGVGFSALSCLVLALPHAIYGPGQDALALTKEYMNATILTRGNETKELPICSRNSQTENCNDGDLTDTSIVPRLLVFFSQFILGIGTTLYYGLGQTYMDDNTKKKNTPLLLGFTFALRTVGPAFGFVLGYLCLNVYIDPSLHPIIEKKDPRWLGAWWLGWIILGITMAIFAVLLSMFPHELRKSKRLKKKENALSESEVPLKIETSQPEKAPSVETTLTPVTEKPSLKDFPKTVKRILKNKLLMFNIFSGVFYVLSASSFMNFIAKYLEVQYQTSPGGGTVVTGPLSLLGMVLGFLISGIVIGKYKPAPRPLLFWNVLVGFAFFFGTIGFVFLGCDSGKIQGIDFDTKIINLTASCNAACNCENVKYSPVCHEASRTTFISACHAGCTSVINDTVFGQCSCVVDLESSFRERSIVGASLHLVDDFSKTFQYNDDYVGGRVTVGPCKQDCFVPWMMFGALSTFINILGCSGRIGNVLLNFRCVEIRDKSLAQGIALMMVSLFALIPGPIIFGAIMDSTCLVWDFSCQKKGNCWLYHRENFRYYVNVTSAALCFIGVLLDMVVCYLSKGIDLYGDEEEKEKRRVSALKNVELKLNNDDPKQSS